jgi:hypothetical protein
VNPVQILQELADPSALIPWDEERISDADAERLGCFRLPIQKLLRRDPCTRISAKEFRLEVENSVCTASKQIKVEMSQTSSSLAT